MENNTSYTMRDEEDGARFKDGGRLLVNYLIKSKCGRKNFVINHDGFPERSLRFSYFIVYSLKRQSNVQMRFFYKLKL